MPKFQIDSIKNDRVIATSISPKSGVFLLNRVTTIYQGAGKPPAGVCEPEDPKGPRASMVRQSLPSEGRRPEREPEDPQGPRVSM